jgi:hypothetical protein
MPSPDSEEQAAAALPERGFEVRTGWERILDGWLCTHGGWIVALVLLLGFLWRIRAASGTFLNSDEALHVLTANQGSLRAAYEASLALAHPPLLVLVLNLWRKLGTSELLLRLPSVIAGTVFCWAAFQWLASLLGRAAGWIGLMLVTFLPVTIQLSAEVRQYALLLCFSVLAAYLLERAFAEDSAGKLLLSSAFLYLTMLAHFSAILFAAALAGYSLLRLTGHRYSGPTLAAWAAGQAGALGLFIFLYRTHIARLRNSPVAQYTMPSLLPNSYFHPGHHNPLWFAFARTFGVFQFVFTQLAVGDLAGLMFLGAVVLLFKSNKKMPQQNSPGARHLATFLLLPFGLNCAAAMLDLYPYGGTRHSSFLIPFAVAGVSLGLTRMTRPRLAHTLAAAIVTIAVCQVFGVPHRPFMRREDQGRPHMTQAIAAIQQKVSPGDIIFVDLQSDFLIRFYLCPNAGSELSASRFESYPCSGQRVISTGQRIYLLSADSFQSQWNDMVRQYQLKPGQTVWMFQAGWDIGLARGLQEKFPQFRDLESDCFGRNICLFKLTVEPPRARSAL